jgi:prepilin-type N-terminal cleavage/methylation domain-containing protein
MNTHATRSKDGEDGFTLVEVMVSAILVAIFFASLFELNAMCLRYIDSSKESLAALQSVQDRAEALRNRAFSDLTRTGCGPCDPLPSPAPPCVTIPCVHDAMATAANPAPFSQKATEVVTISNYPPTANGVTQFTRSPDGSVTTNSLRTDLVTDLVKVDVQVSWTMAVGGRTRTEQTSCIVSDGTKK